MRFTTFTALALVMAGSALGAPPMETRSMLVKESTNAPRGWVRRGPAPDAALVPLSIGLKQRDMAGVEAQLLQVSDPSSPRYLKHLSREEVASMLAPAPESVDAVRRWLAGHGVEEDISKRSFSGDWVRATVSVAKARSMLGDADFAEWHNERSGETLVRAIEYSLPREIFDHVDVLTPTTYFGKPLAHRSPVANVEMMPDDFKPSVADVVIGNSRIASNGAVPAACANTSTTTIQCIRELYGTADYKVQKPNAQFIGISGFLEEYPNEADLAQFEATQRPDAVGYKYSLVQLNGGGNDQADPGVEANLDVQTVAGIAYPIPSTYYSNGGRPPIIFDTATPTNTNEPYATEFEYLLKLAKTPSVVSTSYGDNEQTVPFPYALRVCGEIAALGLRGVSMVFSSGDNGVGFDDACISNDGKNTTKFTPSFPASCPYSITIGGTEGYSPEVAVSDAIGGFYGGAGFSEYFPAPKYQKKVINAYLKTIGNQYKGLYNPKGRAYPDLAAQASKYLIVIGGKYGRVGGTSASAPAVASILALLNDARAAIGKPYLGFINPLLYSGFGSKYLTDITSGSSAGCNTKGFAAQPGWDPATGFGTPSNFKKLLAGAVAL